MRIEIALTWIAVSLALSACSKSPEEPTSAFKPSEATPLPPPPSHLEKEDVRVGTGPEVRTGDTVHVQYTGTLMNGTKFDSSYDNGDEPFTFTLGEGQVIKGWEEGVVGMRVGGKRKLRIPPELGYGASGNPPNIPGGAGLLFEVELVSID
jgi:FKBP-type peptidyl-prolyl cis-trans isomerase